MLHYAVSRFDTTGVSGPRGAIIPPMHEPRGSWGRGLSLGLFLLVACCPAILTGQTALNCDSAMTTADMRRCAVRDYKDAKRDLNRYFEEARRVATNRALLDSAQAVWERFRDLACRAVGSQYRDGTKQPVVVLTCLVRATRKRLREIYDDFLSRAKTTLPEPK
jgi:uncharacterized protein YecT (DUF1311 family)